MRKTYRKIDDVLQSPLAAIAPPPSRGTTDRVLRSTRLEDSIYTDLRPSPADLGMIEPHPG